MSKFHLKASGLSNVWGTNPIHGIPLRSRQPLFSLRQALRACDEMSVQLKQTAKAKTDAMLSFLVKCHMEILHPLQIVRGQLEAFPGITDMMAIVRLLGALRRRSSAIGAIGESVEQSTELGCKEPERIRFGSVALKG